MTRNGDGAHQRRPRLANYRRLGFQPCWRLAHQVIIDGVEADEVLMELLDVASLQP